MDSEQLLIELGKQAEGAPEWPLPPPSLPLATHSQTAGRQSYQSTGFELSTTFPVVMQDPRAILPSQQHLSAVTEFDHMRPTPFSSELHRDLMIEEIRHSEECKRILKRNQVFHIEPQEEHNTNMPGVPDFGIQGGMGLSTIGFLGTHIIPGQVLASNDVMNNGSDAYGFDSTLGSWHTQTTPQVALDPSALEPSASNSSAFNLSASSPSAFNPASFHPSAFNPSALDPSALDPSALDPSALDPSAFDPSAFDPSAFDPSLSSGYAPRVDSLAITSSAFEHDDANHSYLPIDFQRVAEHMPPRLDPVAIRSSDFQYDDSINSYLRIDFLQPAAEHMPLDLSMDDTPFISNDFVQEGPASDLPAQDQAVNTHMYSVHDDGAQFFGEAHALPIPTTTNRNINMEASTMGPPLPYHAHQLGSYSTDIAQIDYASISVAEQSETIDRDHFFGGPSEIQTPVTDLTIVPYTNPEAERASKKARPITRRVMDKTDRACFRCFLFRLKVISSA
jgi:hypothetical protein